MRLKAKTRRTFFAAIFALTGTLLLSACGPIPGDSRPDNSTLITAIDLLINNFQQKHPSLVNWKIDAVKAQLQGQFPLGEDTDAGWLLVWPNPEPGQLKQVIVPWTLIGQYPNHPKPLGYRYQGGSIIPQATIDDITKVVIDQEASGDPFLTAVVNVRESNANPQWAIFSTEPYLPFTDPAYGFATVANKHWKIADFGTANVGCTTVPKAVESEFGFKC